MSENVWISLIGLGGICVTAVVGPAVIAVVNHLITTRNDAKKKALDVAAAQDRRIRALEREVRRLSREGRLRTSRPVTNPARKGNRP